MIRVGLRKTSVGNLYRSLPKINAIGYIDFNGLSDSVAIIINANKYIKPFQAVTAQLEQLQEHSIKKGLIKYITKI